MVYASVLIYELFDIRFMIHTWYIQQLKKMHVQCSQRCECYITTHCMYWVLVAVGSSGILNAKQKLGVTFNFDKQDIIDFTKFSKMTMCRAS